MNLRTLSLGLLSSSLLVVALTGCIPGLTGDNSDAQLTLTPSVGTPLSLTHDPLTSTVSLSPPSNGRLQLTFSSADPDVTVAMALDGNAHAEGDAIALPTGDVVITAHFNGQDFTDPTGTLTVDALALDEPNGTAALNTRLDVTLQGNGDTLNITGFIAGSVP
jgi:hypothetical protein